jgi:hypothetical protein
VTLALLMVFQISVAMAIGFVLGRIWQIRCDLEQERAGGFTAPPASDRPFLYFTKRITAGIAKLPELVRKA